MAAAPQKHPRLQPFLNSIIDFISKEGSTFLVNAETVPITSRTSDLSELSKEKIDDLKNKGFTSVEVRVFQGNSPNYISHVFPLVEETPVASFQNLGGGLGSIGGLAGLNGDIAGALTAEMNSRMNVFNLDQQREKNLELKTENADLKRENEQLKKELDKIPLLNTVGAGLAPVLRGLLSSPDFRNTPLAGLLAGGERDQEPAELQGGDSEFTAVSGLSPELENFAKVFASKFNDEHKMQVIQIIEHLADNTGKIAPTITYLTNARV